MNNAYVVHYYPYESEYDVVGIFLKKEDADRAVARHNKSGDPDVKVGIAVYKREDA